MPTASTTWSRAACRAPASITAHLELNYPPYDALTQVTAKVNKVRADLPEGSEDPVIEVAIGETTSAMYLSFNSTTRPQNQITDYLIRKVQPRIEAVAGVQQAAILGGRNFAMRIWLDPVRMYSLNVTPGDVEPGAAGQQLPGGDRQDQGRRHFGEPDGGHRPAHGPGVPGTDRGRA